MTNHANTREGNGTGTDDDSSSVDNTGAPGTDERIDYAVAFTANGEMEAHTVRSALEAAGIPARIKIEAAQKLFAVTVDGLGAVKVLVPADRLEEAREVLENPATTLGEETSESE